MSKILGKNVTLSIAVVASPQELEVIGCSRSCSLITNVNTAGKSFTGSGIWQEFQALSVNWNCTVEGFATIGENADIETVRALQFALQPIVISFQKIAAGTIYYSGYAIITNVTETGNHADADTYNITLQGTGELIIS